MWLKQLPKVVLQTNPFQAPKLPSAW